MCGIIGVFGNKQAGKLVADGLKNLEHRGKDGHGVSDGKQVTKQNINGENIIGHCLHAVVNKVEQPLKMKGTFAANSEIYNWEELCKKYEIEARNDSETILKLIENFGIEKIEELDGDYACVYWNEDIVYLFRDIVGVKPVWYNLDNGLAFSSEKKILEKLEFKDVEELNPRKILKYDIQNKSIEFLDRKFFETKDNGEEYSIIKKKVKGYLINAIAKRIPDAKIGLLFSGGIDSSIIALILKQLEVDFKCYIAVLEEPKLKEASDLDNAKKVAKELKLDLEVVKVKLEDVKEVLPQLVPLIESTNVTKVGVALPFYFACKKAREDGIKVILSGLGSEEVFAGYQRHKETKDVNKECLSGLRNLYERDLYRDDIVTMFNNIELRVPFLDKQLIEYGLSINPKYKIDKYDKEVLRGVAFELGLNKKIAYRKKIAAQYGSNFAKAIDKLSRKHSNKSEYLKQFYEKPNVKLGALFSSGKDSCYAMWTMIKQNYSIECLISIASKNKDSYMFHTPNIEFIKEQSKAMEIPLVWQETEGEKEKELEDLKEALIKAKELYKIEGVVSGALFSSYQRDRIEKICDGLGLKIFTPLWHKNQEMELRELINEGFEVIVSSVAADGLGEKWLGRKLTLKDVIELKDLNKKYGINVAFEGGEAETFVLDAPIFKKKIIVKKAEKKMEAENLGNYIIKEVELAEK